MLQASEPTLDDIGIGNAAVVAAAYDQAVSILSLNDPLYVPSRGARLDMVRAMLTWGNENGFDQDRLTLTALAAGRTEADDSGF